MLPADEAVTVDDEDRAPQHAAERHPVRLADAIAVVRKQGEGQPIRTGELLVALDALQADAPDLGAEFFEPGEVVLIAA